ncbi:glycosyltransferase family 2 protein [bacterium]|nr:glycosyltransferase family 2 protein [bacterium]
MAATIALLVPCFNEQDTIAGTIAQARNQTRPFDEIVCYDDCSSDDTTNVLQQLGVKVLRGHTNRGPAHGRNELLQHCSSDFLHFHDADDPFLADNFVETLLPHADEKKAAFCDWSRIAEDGTSKLYAYSKYVATHPPSCLWLDHHLHLNSVIYPAKWLRDNGVTFDATLAQHSPPLYNEDVLFNLMAAAAGLGYTHLPEVYATHVRNDSSITSDVTLRKMHIGGLVLVRKALLHVTGSNLSGRQILSNKLLYHLRELVIHGEDIPEFSSLLRLFQELPVPIQKRGKIETQFQKFFGIAASLSYLKFRKTDK